MEALCSLKTFLGVITVLSLCLTLIISCKVLKGTTEVGWSKSHCFSRKEYISPTPSYECIRQCLSTLGCIAVITDSMEMSMVCCILAEKSINLTGGHSVVIHESDIRVCLGSHWTGQYPAFPQHESEFTFQIRFDGLGHNCSHFSGMSNKITFEWFISKVQAGRD